jgi:hypothetical protein
MSLTTDPPELDALRGVADPHGSLDPAVRWTTPPRLPVRGL